MSPRLRTLVLRTLIAVTLLAGAALGAAAARTSSEHAASPGAPASRAVAAGGAGGSPPSQPLVRTARTGNAVAAGTASAATARAATAAASTTATTRPVRVGAAPPRPPGAHVTGTLPATKRLRITVALEPRDAGALAAYAAAVSRPGSSIYHRYLSVSRFARRFGATSDQVAAVRASLRAHGLRAGAVSPNGLAVAVTADAGAIGHGFSTTLETLRLADGRTAFANREAPLVDGAVAHYVQGVVGLDDLSPARPELIRQRPAAAHAAGSRAATSHAAQSHAATSGPQPCSSATSAAQRLPGTYTADQIAGAYDVTPLYAAGDQGAGQSVAIYELEANIPSDITAYQQCYGTNAAVSYVPVDGGPAPLDRQAQDGSETELDVDGVIGVAPQANVLVYQGPNDAAGVYDTYAAIINDDRADVVTTSWGTCEPDLGLSEARAENTLFQEAAAQGQTVLSAAGDSGSEDCYTSDQDPGLAVDDPASQPLVTGVGGSSLTLSPGRSETVWNSDAGATGGGVSSLWSMPNYQAQAPSALGVIASGSSGSPCRATSGYCREVPDVASDADPNTGLLAFYSGRWIGVGGTSAASPTWAGLMALANASSACAGSRLGFANPALYAAAATAYAGDFNDITQGSNDVLGANGGLFSAAPGYDMTTGLGTPQAASLVSTLCKTSLTVTNPGAQVTIVGARVTLAIRANKQVTYSAQGLPPGLSINTVTGIISGAPTRAGRYDVTVTVTDSVGGKSQTAFAWRIDPAKVTLTSPGNRATVIGTRVQLGLHAATNNGTTPAYTATGLPRGLLLNGSSGLISGKPTRAGNYKVTLVASDSGASSGVSFTWSISGPPRASSASLSGIASGRTLLRFTVTAGANAALRTVAVRLASNLSFTATRGTSVFDASGRRLHLTATLVHGVLRITVPGALRTVRISIQGPVRASAALARAVRSRKRPTVPVSVAVTTTTNLLGSITLRLRAS